MNNEKYNQIIDDAYNNYLKNGQQEADRNRENQTFLPIPKQMFINKIKTDLEFSERWGLKIEERELNTVRERKKYDIHFDDLIGEYEEHHITLDKRGVPRKIITITYNNETIESYEN